MLTLTIKCRGAWPAGNGEFSMYFGRNAIHSIWGNHCGHYQDNHQYPPCSWNSWYFNCDASKHTNSLPNSLTHHDLLLLSVPLHLRLFHAGEAAAAANAFAAAAEARTETGGLLDGRRLLLRLLHRRLVNDEFVHSLLPLGEQLGTCEGQGGHGTAPNRKYSYERELGFK